MNNFEFTKYWDANFTRSCKGMFNLNFLIFKNLFKLKEYLKNSNLLAVKTFPKIEKSAKVKHINCLDGLHM